MVLQAYGAAVPPAPKAPVDKASRRGMMKAVGAAALCLTTIALLAASTQLPSQKPEALVQESLHWGTASEENYFHHSESSSNANKWVTQLAALKQRQIARRKKEDAEYFSGVDKAFGKKAGAAMESEFDGKSKGQEADAMLAKLKVDNKRLTARKEEITRNTLTPHRDAVIKQVDNTAAKDKKHLAAVAAKKAQQAVATKHAPAATKASDDKKTVVKEALKVAKKMSEHKDPVAHSKKPAAKAEEKKAEDKKEDAKKPAEAKKAPAKPKLNLEHPGVVADSRKIKELVHKFHHAHGDEKKVLKARVMQLQQQIVSDFKQVTDFGVRASTKFEREEAKAKAAKK